MWRAVALLGLLGASCNYVFPRDEGVAPGEVRGRALRTDTAEDASYARVSLSGSNLARRALADGTFTISGLSAGRVALRVDDDPDGDGWPDRGGYASALLAANAENRTTFVLLGDVALTGSMLVRGEVQMDAGGTPADNGFIARAYVTRGLCFDLDSATPAQTEQSPCAIDVADRVETGAEAVTSADALGAFQLDGVLSGDVEVSVLLYANDGGDLGAPVAVQGPFRISGDAQQDPENVVVVFPAPTPLGTAPVQVATQPPASGDSILLLSEPGRPASCAAVPPIDDVTAFPLAGGEVQLEVPLGIWDVTVCDGAFVGRAFAQAVLTPKEGELPPRWRVNLFAGDACTREQPDSEIDCDGDGLLQLPLFSDATAELWQDCTEDCDALGEALGDKSCVVDGDSYDCDDEENTSPF